MPKNYGNNRNNGYTNQTPKNQPRVRRGSGCSHDLLQSRPSLTFVNSFVRLGLICVQEASLCSQISWLLTSQWGGRDTPGSPRSVDSAAARRARFACSAFAGTQSGGRRSTRCPKVARETPNLASRALAQFVEAATAATPVAGGHAGSCSMSFRSFAGSHI